MTYHPTTRLLTVLELLQAHPRMNAQQLSERLEVNQRTVRKYIVMLQDLGIPVESERGRSGGYRLRPGFKLPPLMFSTEEALALTLGLLTARKLGLTVATPAVEGALAKIERVLPEQVRNRVQAVQETLIIDTLTPYLAPSSATLAALSSAAQQQQSVQLAYATWNGVPSERVFDPYGLVHHGGRWYTAGYCHLRQDIRVFRLDRIQSIIENESQFTRPAHLPLLDLVLESIARTPGRWEIVVLLHTDLAHVAKCVPRSLALLEAAEGGVVFRCFAQQLDWVGHFLLGLDCELTIRAPGELREVMRQLAQRAERSSRA